MSIYLRMLATLQEEGALTTFDEILVTCGGDTDAQALRCAGQRNVLVTNLDERRRAGIGRARWQHCDAEDIPFPADSFDWGMVHMGLHHCRSPHRGLLELLRVSRKGVLVIEARDSLLMRAAVRLGLTVAYELESVALGMGGLRNGNVPNFIYRWTEREVRKTVESAMPDQVSDFRFFYGLALPTERMTMCSRGKQLAARIGGVFARALFRLAPSQGNQFAFAIIKTGKRKPWIREGQLAADYPLGFDPARYVREAA